MALNGLTLTFQKLWQLAQTQFIPSMMQSNYIKIYPILYPMTRVAKLISDHVHPKYFSINFLLL